MVDGDMVRDRVVPAVNLTANSAHEPVLGLLDVLLVATPTWNDNGPSRGHSRRLLTLFIVVRNDHVSVVVEGDSAVRWVLGAVH